MKKNVYRVGMKKIIIGAAIIPLAMGGVLPSYGVNAQSEAILTSEVVEQHVDEYDFSEEAIQENFNVAMQAIIQRPVTRTTARNQVEIAGFVYEFTGTEGDSTAEIIGYTGTDTEIVIPSTVTNTIEGWATPSPVTVIGAYAFNDKGLTSISLPVNLQEIGGAAFAYNNLSEVTIPNDVQSIGNIAFAQNNLTRVTLGTGVHTIGSFAFYNNQLASLVIPASMQTIQGDAFLRNNLENVSLGANIQQIGQNAFGENDLTSITIPNSVTELGMGAFYSNKLSTVTIGSGVNTLNQAVFAYNELSTVTIPATIQSIGVSAFRDNNLITVNIPENVTQIDQWAFRDNQLASIYFSEETEIDVMGDAVFQGNPLATMIVSESTITDYVELLTPAVMDQVTVQTVLRTEKEMGYTEQTQRYLNIGIGNSFELAVEGVLYQLNNLTDYAWVGAETLWIKDGTLTGQTGPHFELSDVTLFNSGLYHARIVYQGTATVRNLPIIQVSVVPL